MTRFTFEFVSTVIEIFICRAIWFYNCLPLKQRMVCLWIFFINYLIFWSMFSSEMFNLCLNGSGIASREHFVVLPNFNSCLYNSIATHMQKYGFQRTLSYRVLATAIRLSGCVFFVDRCRKKVSYKIKNKPYRWETNVLSVCADMTFIGSSHGHVEMLYTVVNIFAIKKHSKWPEG